MTPHHASRSGACPWGGAATPVQCALSTPCQGSAQSMRQALPKRQPAGTGRRSTGAVGLIPVGVRSSRIVQASSLATATGVHP
jgi:hypothetical protein